MEDFDFDELKPTVDTIPKKKKKVVKYKTSENVDDNAEKKTDKTRKKGDHGIWVGNLNFTTTRKSLFEHFKNCGHINRIKLPVDKQNKNKGYDIMFR